MKPKEFLENVLFNFRFGKNNKTVFSEIYKKNLFDCDETKSGAGSSIEWTRAIRSVFSELLKRYQIESILDCPCGDFNWMKMIDLEGIEYLGGDIVDDLIAANRNTCGQPNVQFQVMDIVKSPFPKKDLVLVRDCFVHLGFEDIMRAIRNIKESGSKYLLTTTYPATERNRPRAFFEKKYSMRRWNLEKEPFNFPPPREYVNDERPGLPTKKLGLWLLKDVEG